MRDAMLFMAAGAGVALAFEGWFGPKAAAFLPLALLALVLMLIAREWHRQRYARREA